MGPSCGRLPAAAPRLPRAFYTAAALAICLALLPPLCVAWYRAAPKRQPRIHPLHDMAFQPKYKAQAANDLFADGRAMRPPVAGTVARGALDEDPRQAAGKDGAGNYASSIPRPPGAAIDRAMILRGKDRFRISCAPCHGLTGGMPEGTVGEDAEKWEGMVSIRAARRAAGGEGTWTPPRVLTSAYVQDQPDGKLFETISQGVVNQGVRTMPGYAVQIPREDRWAIVLYVRALGRSQNASAGEVPPDMKAKASTRPSTVCTMPVSEVTPVSVPVLARTQPAPGPSIDTRYSPSPTSATASGTERARPEVRPRTSRTAAWGSRAGPRANHHASTRFQARMSRPGRPPR